MVLRWLVICTLGACGRIAFDAQANGGDGGAADGGADGESIGGSGGDAVPASPGQQAYVKASNTDPTDAFGGKLALSADGSTLVVGAEGEGSTATGVGGDQTNNSAQFAGAVYVFVRNGTAWTQQAYLKASNTQMRDGFGRSLALSSDGNVLAVGAPAEASAATGLNGNQADNSAPSAGAVYVFVRSGGVWAETDYLKASNTNANDEFGFAIALSGDGATLAVGAVGEASKATGIDGNQADNSAMKCGAVYVFVHAGAAWSQQAYLKASNADAQDSFGISVALSDDGATLGVGAGAESSKASGVGGDQADNSARATGAAYVFSRAGTTWTQQAYVKPSNPDPFDRFGVPLVLSGDGNTLAVTAIGEGSTATGVDGDQTSNDALNSGAVYVYSRGAVWAQSAYIKASNSEADDIFGGALALNGDGTRLLAGAYAEGSRAIGVDGDQSNNDFNSAGAVYSFVRSGTRWAQVTYLKSSNTQQFAQFGASVAVSRDGTTVAVGAPSESSKATGIDGDQSDRSASAAGAVYLFQ